MKRLIQIIKLYLVFLLVFELGRIYFVFYNANLFEGVLFNTLVQTIFKGFRLDLSASAYCVLPFLLIFIVEFIFKRKCPRLFMKGLLYLELFIVFMITISDPELYIQWGNKFNNQVLVYISHPKEMALSAGSVNWIKTLIFSVILLICYYFIIKLFIRIFNKELAFSWQYLSVTIGFLLINFIFIRGGVGVATISQASAIYSSNQAENAAAVNSLWNAMYYCVNDTRSLYGKKHLVVDSQTAASAFSNQIEHDMEEIVLSNTQRPNVIIIMLESFTASASYYFSGQNTCTPFLDRMANENFSFLNCYASGDRTEKGLVAVNSAYPSQPVSSISVFPDKVNKLNGISKELKKIGYINSFLYGGDAEFASMKSYLLMQGFNKIIDKKDFPSKSLTSKWGAHDSVLYSIALSQFDQQNNPFYSILLSLSSHEPFDVPFESKDLKQDVWYGYKNALRYADYSLYRFIESCKQKPWYANTLIILVADHGHDIGLPDLYFFGKEKFHIPLIVLGGALKKEFKGVKVKQVVSQTIIPSLIMQSFGIKTNGFNWQSKSTDSLGFAQYAFNDGFGRVSNNSECVYDNNGLSYYYKGLEVEKEPIKMKGRIFQQVLIDDFLKK